MKKVIFYALLLFLSLGAIEIHADDQGIPPGDGEVHYKTVIDWERYQCDQGGCGIVQREYKTISYTGDGYFTDRTEGPVQWVNQAEGYYYQIITYEYWYDGHC